MEPLPVSIWTVEVHLCDMWSASDREIVTLDGGEDAEMVLKLAQVGAQFDYKGKRYFAPRPCVNPIERKLVYYCEGYSHET